VEKKHLTNVISKKIISL